VDPHARGMFARKVSVATVTCAASMLACTQLARLHCLPMPAHVAPSKPVRSRMSLLYLLLHPTSLQLVDLALEHKVQGIIVGLPLDPYDPASSLTNPDSDSEQGKRWGVAGRDQIQSAGTVAA
jgi:hypothetical protein